VTINYHQNVIQGSDEWVAMRCGLITASEMGLLLTPTLKTANNDKSRGHVYELVAQRISQYVEPHYVGSDMLRGEDEEILARDAYRAHYAPVTEVGFITNDKWGFTLGYSPDGIVGDDGLIEAKSRRQKFQVQTLIGNLEQGTAPTDFLLQAQTGLLVSERKWMDLLSYCGGLPMAVIRVLPDPLVHEAIIAAARSAEADISAKIATYQRVTQNLIHTPRIKYEDMHL
jgi:YqaJ-like viral recombinase domain